MKRQKHQSGFAHLMVITVILGLTVVGLLSYVFWQNFVQSKDNVAKTDNSSKVAEKDNKKPVVDESGDISDSTKGYLVLEDWGVKFKQPSDIGSSTINYYLTSDGSYEFTTSKIEALGQDCSHDSSHFMPQYYVTRMTSAPNPEAASGGVLLKKIENYYYNLNSSQAPCSDVTGASNVFNTDRPVLESFLKTIEKK